MRGSYNFIAYFYYIFTCDIFTDLMFCLVKEKSKICDERNQDVRETSRSRGMR